MSKGREKHAAYEEALSLLGRDLARRSKSRCELSGERGTLVVVDLEGSKVEPSLGHVVMVSPTVAEHLAGDNLEGAPLHYLETAVWSDVSAVRRAAIQILERLDAPWARDAIENARMMENAAEDG